MDELQRAKALREQAGRLEEIGRVKKRLLDLIEISQDPYYDQYLKQMLKDELAKQGYEVGDVEITVGTTYEAVGEGLEAGTIDVGLIPGGTYVLYDDGAEVILTATRDGLSKDSDNAKDWNDGQPTLPSDKQAVSYRALMIAGPSEKGQAVAAKVNAGEELTWDDINGLNWSVMNSSSSAGYIYPALWMQERYGKGITDLALSLIHISEPTRH